MAISLYQIGQVPSRPIAIDVRDSDGNEADLSSYASFTVRLIDPENGEVDLTGSSLTVSGASVGHFIFRWPTDRSLFDQTGEYLLQMEIDGVNGTKDFTTPHTIRVRRLGGVN
jgi:hypothetical protein